MKPIPVDKLKACLRRGRLEVGESCLPYSRDCWPQAQSWPEAELRRRMPAAAALPADEEEVAAVLSWASLYGVPLVPRGGGSGVVGAAVPASEGSVVLDTSLLKERFELLGDSAEPRVVAGAGWLGGELEQKLNGLGWSLMNFPASMDVSTVGGWVAAGSSGQLSTRYGGIESQVLSVRATLPGGRSMEESPVPHLGAEGTLGVITQVKLRVRPLPRKRRFAAYAFPDAPSALRFARLAVSALVPPSVLRVYSPLDALLSGLRWGRGGGGESPFRSRAEAFLLRRRRLLELLSPLAGREWIAVLVYEEERGGAGEPPAGVAEARGLGPEPARRWWRKRYHWSRERLERTFAAGCFADTADLWAGWKDLAGMRSEVTRALSGCALVFSHYSHFDREGACLYVTFAGAGDRERHARAWRDAMEACVAAGGRVNHHHGFGLAKLPWLESGMDRSRLRALRWEKEARDPQHLLNPGKLAEAACR